MNTLNIILKRIISIFILITILMAHFAVVGGAIVSYAIDTIKIDNGNVEISAYFVKGENKLTKIESEVNEVLTLKIDIAVKNKDGLGGYFDGEIEIGNGNLKLKDENKIQVHINAEESQTIEKEVEFLYNENIDGEYFSKDTEINVSGKYVNSKRSANIKGTCIVNAKWISKEDTNLETKMEVLTNHIYTVNEENKRVLQVLYEGKLNNDSYPVKNTQIKIDVPEEAKNVKVHKRTTAGTNGDKEFKEENYNVNSEEKKVIINIENVENAIWKKGSSDVIVVTYEFDENANIENTKLTGNTKVTLYDGKELTANSEVTVKEDKDGSITNSIEENEKEIYKGKIYTNENREYTSTTKIYIDYLDSVNKVEVDEKQPVYISKDEEKEANIEYISSTIRKEEFDKIFGEDGFLNIKDQDGNAIANINKDSKVDDNGNIKIEYAEGVTSLNIVTSSPKNIGILNIINNKVIKEDKLTREEKEELTAIKDKSELNGKNTENTITLKETVTEATIEVENTNLRNSKLNEDVKIEISLLTNNEDKDLYKEPTFEITFPSEARIVKARYGMLYGNGLEIADAVITNENGKKVLKLSTEGEQEKYPTEAVEETKILVYANIEVDESAKSGEENITLKYTNKKAVSLVDEGIKQAKVNIIADKVLEEKEQGTETTPENLSSNLRVNVVTSVGDSILKNEDEVKAGETIRYKATVTNTGNKEAKNVKITGNVPEGTTYVTVNKKLITYGVEFEESELDIKENGDQYFIDELEYYNKTDEKEITSTVSIKPNESATIEYEVKVNDNIEDGKTSTNTITAVYDEKEIYTRNISHKLKNGDIEITTIPVLRNSDTEKLKLGYAYQYNVRIKNTSNKEKKNVVLKLMPNSNLKLLDLGIWKGNDYKEFGTNTTITIGNIQAGETIKLDVRAQINNSDNGNTDATLYAIAMEGNNTYRSNKVYEEIESNKVDISLSGSSTKEYIQPGDEITYTINIKNVGDSSIEGLSIEDEISGALDIQKIVLDGKELSQDSYTLDYLEDYHVASIDIENKLQVGESKIVKVYTKLSDDFKTSKDIEIANKAKVSVISEIGESKQVTYKVKANIAPGESGDYSGTTEGVEGNTISGVAWLDQNRDGKRDASEATLSDIEVMLIDVSTSRFAKDASGAEIKGTTNENGEYTLSYIPNGTYIAIFKYNSEIYTTTTYQIDEADSRTNSDAIARTLKIDGVPTIIGATDTLDVNGNRVNVDIGLVEIGKLDLKVEKTVTKMIVNNNDGTKTYNYNENDLAKIEIGTKSLKGSTVLVEYKIKVKNEGTVAGYAKNVADYYPNVLKFNPEINEGWYQQGRYIYNETLANDLIEPGDERELKVTFSITMTESNTGLINNIAGIEEAIDANGNTMENSATESELNEEAGTSSADIIIGVRTGAVVSYVITILTTIIIIGIAAYIINKHIIKLEKNI